MICVRCYAYLLTSFICVSAIINCNDIVEYDESGYVNIGASVYACSEHLPDPLSPVSYYKNEEGDRYNLTLYSQYNLNNLVKVDEIEGVAEINFYWRVFWYDPRWNMTSMWRALNDETIEGLGFEIYWMTIDEDNPLRLWLSDLMFEQLVDINIFAHTMKLFPNGKIYWSRLTTVTLKQPGFDYTDYPMDRQGVVVSTMSYGLSSAHLRSFLLYPPVLYNHDDHGISFKQNPVWKTDVGDYSYEVYARDLSLNPNVSRVYDVAAVTVYVDRDGSGVLVRFALPILILLCLAGVTFWAEIGSRIDTTMTVLLSVSALYVVIIGNIPLLGYLTLFDTWILNMFILLTLCVCLHQFVGRIIIKQNEWPFRKAAVRALEAVGRAGLIPSIMIMFYIAFSDDEKHVWIAPLLFACTPIFALIALREIAGTVKQIRVALGEVRAKLEDPLHCTTSPLEMFWYNLFTYGALSTSRSRYKRSMLARRRLASLTEQVNSGSGNPLTPAVNIVGANKSPKATESAKRRQAHSSKGTFANRRSSVTNTSSNDADFEL